MKTNNLLRILVAAAFAVGLNTPAAVALGAAREDLTISHNVPTFITIEEGDDSSLIYDIQCDLAGHLETMTDPPAVAEDSLVNTDSMARSRRWRDEFYVRDHLGNVRVVVDLAAESPEEFVLERNDFLPFGTRAESDGLPVMESNRYRYAGKEAQRLAAPDGTVDLGLLDFGARMYDPYVCRWMAVDPMAHRYPATTPYGYCGGDPINRVDPDGRETWVLDNNNLTYTVCGGRTNNDCNIYIVDKNHCFVFNASGGKVSIGKSMTPISFYNQAKKEWIHTTIDLRDMTSDSFIHKMTDYLLPLGTYMENAKNNAVYDFKITDGTLGNEMEDHFRGRVVYINGTRVIASARDVGNYVAGYYAGANGFSWAISRKAFDHYQGSIEEPQTQQAQYAGWEAGRSIPLIEKERNFIMSIPSLFSYFRHNIMKF